MLENAYSAGRMLASKIADSGRLILSAEFIQAYPICLFFLGGGGVGGGRSAFLDAPVTFLVCPARKVLFLQKRQLPAN